ncbi:PepSY domain-containing protein [Gemmatimonas groenlandica]|uniref:PepSY domain-containing protein n=1 Tax=Gemmatimonas groenlandica TaxID=2732249 RepID=A0A6M4IQI7_9BACT|nr:PepSY domain-containing protein [Gemmatimonas groenlandica]QJR34521.1 PepSY domain-containing protein [Gemmatimonas groenlandica]
MTTFNPRIWNRKLHRWGSIGVALPFVIVLCSGLLLQLKKQLAWVQPPEEKTSVRVPTVTMEQILATAQSVPEAKVSSWADIDRLDVRPGKGIVKVATITNWEIQMELATGALLQSAYRRSDLIETIHDGSFFHPLMKLWVFFPAAVIVLGLWITGMYLFILPFRARANKRRVVPSSVGPSAE